MRSGAQISAGRPPRRLVLLAFAIPFLVYLLPHRYHGSGDTVPAELLPVSLLRQGNLDFNEFQDPHADLPYYFSDVRGKILSSYPILPGLLNVPVFAVAKSAGVNIYDRRSKLSLISAAILSAASVMFLFLALRHLCDGDRQALGFAFVYAFATTAWTVGGVALFQHGPSLLFLCAAIWVFVQPRESLVPLAGLFLGLAVVNRPVNLVLAMPLAIHVAISHRARFARFAALAAVPGILLAVYSQAYWGSIWKLGQGQGGWGFDGNMLSGLAGILASPSRGIFVYSPILILGAAYGVRALVAHDDPPVVRWLMAGAVSLTMVVSLWGMWWGGSSWAYRLLTETVPALVVALALSWDRWLRPVRWRRLVFAILLTVSVLIQMVGIWGFPSGFNQDIDFETARLWNWSESPLTLGAGVILHKYGLLAKRPGVHHIPPDRGPLAERANLYHVWWKPELNDDSIPGWCDSPARGQRVLGALAVDGWAQSRSGSVDVAVVLDRGRVVARPTRIPRPDVARAFPDMGDCSTAGWRVVFPPSSDLPTRHTITVELRSPAGRVRFLGPIEITWSARP